MEWVNNGVKYRLATAEETGKAREEGDAPHVYFGCLCGHGVWHAKNIALGREGGYNGARNIFFAGDWAEGECACPPAQLRHIVCD